MGGKEKACEPIEQHVPPKRRVIFHVDMNAFYCSVHEAEEPTTYRNKPTAVAGSVELRKGIIVTCSYTARRRGVRTGMRVKQALRLCPQLVLIRPDFHLYRRYSQAFVAIVRNYTPLVEVASIDECYLDISGSKLFGTPLEIANELQQRIREELSLPCSIGIAPNKLLAKMASNMKKPNGITVLRIRDVPKLLWELPSSELFGIGQKTAMKLAQAGIRTIGELAQADEARLVSLFGVQGHWMKPAANGVDEDAVCPEREPNKSVGHTMTLPQDVTAKEDVRRVLLQLADQVARRIRSQRLMAQTVQLTIRTPEMKTITRSATFEAPTDDAARLLEEAWRLYKQHWPEERPIRLLGITGQNMVAKEAAAIQLDLFDFEQQPKRERLIQVMDQIRDKYGENALVTLGMLGDDPSAMPRKNK